MSSYPGASTADFADITVVKLGGLGHDLLLLARTLVAPLLETAGLLHALVALPPLVAHLGRLLLLVVGGGGRIDGCIIAGVVVATTTTTTTTTATATATTATAAAAAATGITTSAATPTCKMGHCVN